MELCDGGAVSDIFSICNEGLTEDQIAVVTRETLKALVYLHGVNIIHRDIKGANILLNNNGDIKLVDFGVSAELKQANDKRNTLIGTPYWMAPVCIIIIVITIIITIMIYSFNVMKIIMIS